MTGLPGAAKTLYTLCAVKSLAEKDQRPVYYSGIVDCKLPWIELDKPEEWHQLPINAIVVIDEAQRIFRPRGQGSAVPPHVAELETHRHKGIDLFLITQHPMLLDANVRRLVGRHLHAVRNFGMRRSTVHEWQECKPRCDESRADSVRHEFGYPVEAFAWYKSAEAHTHQRRLPARLFFLLAAPFIVAALVWWAWSRMSAETVSKPKPGAILTQDSKGAVPVSDAKQLPKTATEYVRERMPRLQDFPESAPVFDGLATPKVFPVIAACVSSKKNGCLCYTQQGTRLSGISEYTCASFVARGAFDPYRVEARVDARGDGGGQRPIVATPDAPKPPMPNVAPSVPAKDTPVHAEQTPVVAVVPAKSPWRAR